jgi:hypothetical protein
VKLRNSERTRPVLVTLAPRLDRVLDRLADYFAAAQEAHPESGSRFVRLIDRIPAKLLPLLAEQPDIGRPAKLVGKGSLVEQAILEELVEITGNGRWEVREWSDDGFTVLYYRSATQVVLASIKDDRQQSYM